ncbi:hypothetical protein GW846_03315 [Candidatus Gracilibacteria bacterium]|nr:hypothetical protein [Candidatus Gracilibacteria bacterium]
MLKKVTKKVQLFKNPKYPDSYTIDLRFEKSMEYCNSRDWGKGGKIMGIILPILAVLGAGFLVSLIIPITSADYGKLTFEDFFGEERVVIGCYNDISGETREERSCTQRGDHNIMTPPQRDIKSWKKYYNEKQIINRLALVNFESGFSETASNPSAWGYVQTLRSHGISPDIESQLAWMKNREEVYRQRYFQGKSGTLDGCGKYWEFDNLKDGFEAGEYGVLSCLYRFHYHANKGTWYAKRGIIVTEFYKNYFNISGSYDK